MNVKPCHSYDCLATSVTIQYSVNVISGNTLCVVVTGEV